MADDPDWAAIIAECDDPEMVAGADYWQRHADRPFTVEPLGKPCHDCAVVHKFYAGLSIDLARQPDEIIDKVCANWFCHDNPGRGCRGNIDLIAHIRARKAG